MEKTPDAQEAGSPAQDAVGQLLNASRLSQGVGIADVARALRISEKYLEALEDGRNQDLPGTTYAIGFVRSYAEHLNLDGEEMVRRYKDQAHDLPGQSELVFPKPILDGGVPGAAVLGLGVAFAAVAYGVWYWNSNSDALGVTRVDPVPAQLIVKKNTGTAESVPTVTVEPVVKDAVVEDKPEPPTVIVEPVAEPVPAPTEPVETVAPVVQEKAGMEAPVTPDVLVAPATLETRDIPEPVVENTAPEDMVVAAPVEDVANITPIAEIHAAKTRAVIPPVVHDGASRITVRATSNSWIQVRDSVADRLLFTRLLRKGDEYEVPNRAGLRLMTGNAGALELLVDGAVVPPLGAVGEVRRDVELDPDKLKSGGAVAD